MTAVSEGNSRDVPSRRFTGEERGRSKTSLPVDPAIPRRFVPNFRTRQSERRRGRERRRSPRWKKKKPGLYFPLTSEWKRRSWSTRSSTNCLRGTGLGINLLLALRLPCLFALFPPIVFFIPNFTRRVTRWGHCAVTWKKLGRIYIRSDECFLLVRNFGKLNLSMRSENNKRRRQATLGSRHCLGGWYST